MVFTLEASQQILQQIWRFTSSLVYFERSFAWLTATIRGEACCIPEEI